MAGTRKATMLIVLVLFVCATMISPAMSKDGGSTDCYSACAKDVFTCMGNCFTSKDTHIRPCFKKCKEAEMTCFHKCKSPSPKPPGPKPKPPSPKPKPPRRAPVFEDKIVA